MEKLVKILIYLTIICIGLVLGANVYNSVVDGPNWAAKIPESLISAREYMSVANPGNFFRVLSPSTVILAIIFLLFMWKKYKEARKYLFIVIGCMILGDILTFTFFYPRNEILFMKPLEGIDISSLHKIIWEWSLVNHFRSLLVLGAFIASIKSLLIVHK